MGQKIIRSDEITVMMDIRENESGIDKMIASHGAKVVVTNLEVADYILSDSVAVERKTPQDFLNSIKDRRLFDQLEEMSRNFDNPLLVIEGNDLYSISNMHPNAIRGAIASITIDYRVPIITTNGKKETAAQLYWIAKREQVDGKKEISIRGKRRMETLKEQQEYIIAGIPKVSNTISRRLLEHFKSPLGIFNANEDDLQKVKGIGNSLAKKIRHVLDSVYR